MKIEKINDNSNITSNSTQIDILKKNFPNCFDKDGKFIPSKMSEIFNQNDISKESYSLNWLGKSYARLLANENPLTLIKEDKTHNQKEENINSQNLLIKGDNLEVLKHLKNAYSESIKMIYIDPPYNTGSDGFVYNDKRKFSIDELSQLAGVSLNDAKDILDFTNSKSNSHSAWLTFMYPRLYIARELLKDDGVIFISIDDNEVAQLRLLCNEVFGEDNFVSEFVWSGKSGSEDDTYIRNNKEYILCYGKEVENFKVGLDIKKDDKFIYFDELKQDFYKRQLLRKWGDNSRREDRPNLYYPIKDENNNDFYPTLPNGEDGCWRWSKETMNKAISNGIIEFAQNGKYEAYEKIYKSDESKKTKKYQSLLLESEQTSQGTKELKLLFEKKIFDRPKPIKLLKDILKIANTSQNDIILDFFAGSGTTAHAVMDLNKEDNGNRKFITVQLPEPTDPKSEAYRNGYENIFEITKERITRASKKIKDEIVKDVTKDIKDYDLGFKIYETTPLFDGYGDDIELSNQTLFDPKVLSDDDIQTILTTYKLYDGINLSQKSKDITLNQYKCHLVEDKIYFMNSGFETIDLKVFIEKLDNDKEFNPTKIIIFGYNFLSKHQREINEALKNYSNKKSLDIEILVRY
jgi:adenine-specific DNA-methyltransferase